MQKPKTALTARVVVVASIIAGAVAGCVAADRPTAPSIAKTVVPTTGVLMSNGLPPNYVLTPAGGYHRSCVHEIAAGAVVDERGFVRSPEGTISQLAPCNYPVIGVPRFMRSTGAVNPPSPDTGHLAFAWSNTSVDSVGDSTAIAGMNAAVIVPHPPMDTSGYNDGTRTYYIYPGMEPGNATHVVQTVVQYGNNGAFGGTFWTMAGWSCPASGSCMHSTPVTIFDGEAISLNITGVSTVAGGCTFSGKTCWNTTMTSVGRGVQTTGSFADTLVYRQMYGGVMEISGAAVTTCNQFPKRPGAVADILFSGIQFALFPSPTSAYVPVPTPFPSYNTNPSWDLAHPGSPSPSCSISVRTSAAGDSVMINEHPLFAQP
jgi:hypothetical protein